MPSLCQRRMGRLVREDRKATVTQITTCYNQGMQNTISECTPVIHSLVHLFNRTRVRLEADRDLNTVVWSAPECDCCIHTCQNSIQSGQTKQG